MLNIKEFIPPVIINIKHKIQKNKLLYYYGKYSTWEEAVSVAESIGGGYEKPNIFRAEKEAMGKVINGGATYEQDGVLFYEKNVHFQILTSLLYTYSHTGKTCVIDYGGALGSMYFRHRDELRGLNIDWNVLEQKHFVNYGKTNIKDISFYYTLEECLEKKRANFVLFSSVLGYLPNGLEAMKQCMNNGIEYICVDSTAFFMDKRPEQIMIQHVPDTIYRAEYPIHIFNWDDVYRIIEEQKYRIVFQWSREGIPLKNELGYQKTNYKGFLIEKN